MVHHGGASANRGLSNLIEIVKRLDDLFELDLYLVGNSRHVAEFHKQAPPAIASRYGIRCPWIGSSRC